MSEKNIRVEVSGSWLCLNVEGDQNISYPLHGSKVDRDEAIDHFAAALKKAVNGERLSTLY